MRWRLADASHGRACMKSGWLDADPTGSFTEATDYLSTTARKSTFVGDSSGIFEGTEDGDTVAPTDALGLWFQFDAPTGTPSSLEQTITVTVTAQAAN